MKKISVISAFAFVVMSAFAPRVSVKSSIYGTIDPIDGSQKVIAINGTDSVSTVPMMGKFSLDVKPGNWIIRVVAIKPYKDAVVENVLVQEDQSTDAGIIKLQQ